MSKREAVVLGVADLALKDGKVVEPMSVLQAQVARDALADAGIAMREVDGLLTAGLWGNPGPGLLPTVTLSEYLGIVPRFADGTNIGGSAFEAHVAHAATAIEAGRCEVALITYGSLQRSEARRNLAGRPSVLTMQYETPGACQRPLAAMPWRRCATCTTSARPQSSSPRLRWPRANGRRSIPRRRCARRCRSHDAIDVLEVYDSFTITVLMALEALGFCKRGEGGAFVAGQRTAPGGPFPLNTNGGGLSYAHPGCTASPCSSRQYASCVGSAASVRSRERPPPVHGTGGTLLSGATCILSIR